MRPPPARWFAEPVQVQTCTGRGSYGPVLAAPVTLNANISQGTRLVRTTSGDIDESYTVMRFQTADEASITADSIITYQGVPSTVTQVRKLRQYGRLLLIEATTT